MQWFKGGQGDQAPAAAPASNAASSGEGLRGWFPGGNRQEAPAREGILPNLGFSSMQLEDNVCPCELTYKQRLYGFGICCGIGCLISLFNMFAVFGGPEAMVQRQTMANIVSLAGTTFLVGPCSQLKRMIEPTRLPWTVLLFSTMAAAWYLTYFNKGDTKNPDTGDTVPCESWCNFTGRNILLMVLIGAQYFAMLWYTLSFIPYGHAIFTRTVKGFCSAWSAARGSS